MEAKFSLGFRQIAAAFTSLSLCVSCTTSSLGTCPLPLAPNPNLPKRGVSAHQGGLLGCPVNTLGAFKRAICHGVHQIELDVRSTLDDVLVIAHDDRVTGSGTTLRISESTSEQLKGIELPPCKGETTVQGIPTLEQALTIMPQNVWINLDIKNNDPDIGQRIAETVSKAHRFDQVIFSARNKAFPAIRETANASQQNVWMNNMNRGLFRSQYVQSTMQSCAEFIQLVEVPYLPFVRGKPNQDTMDRLQHAGIQINYSWVREENEVVLKERLQDLFDRGVQFVLVDHVEPAMKVANALGISPIVPRWSPLALQSDKPAFDCPSTP